MASNEFNILNTPDIDDDSLEIMEEIELQYLSRNLVNGDLKSYRYCWNEEGIDLREFCRTSPINVFTAVRSGEIPKRKNNNKKKNPSKKPNIASGKYLDEGSTNLEFCMDASSDDETVANMNKIDNIAPVKSGKSKSTAKHGTKQSTSSHKRFYKCDQCEHSNKRYTLGGLKRHMQTHSTTKPYSCDICDEEFSYMDTLTRHKKLHTAIKELKCGSCEKRFYRPDHLKKHEANVHKKD